MRSLPPAEVVAWELLSASEHSPCPVQDDEVLFHQMLDPVHWNSQRNEFTPNAFLPVETIGMSVNRIKFTTVAKIAEQAAERVVQFNAKFPDNPQRIFMGFTVFRCGDLRAQHLKAENGDELRLFGIFDTAHSADTSHADICRLGGAEHEKAHKARAKVVLYDLAKQWLATKSGQRVAANEF